MRIVYFIHSLTSCWNHGNAHFLRGVLRELACAGHAIRVLEPENGWSRMNLLRAGGAAAIEEFQQLFPEVTPEFYGEDPDLDELLDGAELVVVHEWTPPTLVAAIGRYRLGHRFTLLFHDTHHRAASDPDAIRAFDLSCFDGVLAFGESLAEIYRRWGWGSRVHVWHEAADTRLFRPLTEETPAGPLVWIGNWGDGERSEELAEFLLRPAGASGTPFDVYGVRYPENAQNLITRHGGRYRGWLANVRVPRVFARHRMTVHVPRRFYVRVLPGIPTIRVFEALACGIPLVSAPWDDCEHLFSPGEDFLIARSQAEMTRHLHHLTHDAEFRATLAASGVRRIADRHSCTHRARELLAIVGQLAHAEQPERMRAL
jgi:spore maturation protein CgeB